MSLPAKHSRPIEVDGTRYRWLVRRRPTSLQRTGRSPLVLAVARDDGQGTSMLVRLCAHPSNTARLRGQAVTPRVVAAWIRQARQQGWQPEQSGRQFLLSDRGHAIDTAGPRAWPRG
ncbi:MAG: hypothetical protein KDK70_01340, partial [Myxococcales bacterium]|nr:hypothetical protein [Myxococcales bacterium]